MFFNILFLLLLTLGHLLWYYDAMKMILPIAFFVLGIIGLLLGIIALSLAFVTTNYLSLFIPTVLLTVLSSCVNIVFFGCTLFLRSRLCKVAMTFSIIGIIFSAISFIILFSV